MRERLLAINGVGPETADSMLLYAGGHHRFVIDAYTRRIFQRHGWSRDDAGYEELQVLCEAALDEKPRPERLDYWQDYHAQLVSSARTSAAPASRVARSAPSRPLLGRVGNGAA